MRHCRYTIFHANHFLGLLLSVGLVVLDLDSLLAPFSELQFLIAFDKSLNDMISPPSKSILKKWKSYTVRRGRL